MAKNSREDKLELANHHFYSYRFFQAYQIYQQLFSTLAFQADPLLLKHVGSYLRILVELGRVKEIQFYIPILETHFENSKSPLAAYALGYFYYISGNRKRALQLLQWCRDNAKEDGDLRIKTIMILARLADTDDERAILIGTIRDVPQDPYLFHFLEIWRAIIFRYQGQIDQSISSLKTLIAKFDEKNDWYSVIAAEEALVRGYLKKWDFRSARHQLQLFQNRCELQKFRTVKNHITSLNEFYFESLRSRTIEVVPTKRHLTLVYRGENTEVRQADLVALITLFQKSRTLTKRKVLGHLHLAPIQLGDICSRFIEKLEKLNLPSDALNQETQKIHLVPSIQRLTDKEFA